MQRDNINFGNAVRLISEVIQTYLEGECAKDRMLGPLSKAEAQTLPALHINRFAVILKCHVTGKWRLIMDLSYLSAGS